jgi:hypothetical protein
MPLTTRSRYYTAKKATALDAHGNEQPSVAIRLTPSPGPGPFFRHPISAHQSLEYLAWKHYKNSEMWWRIADTNPVRFPLDYDTGERVNISADDTTPIVRDRRF